VKGGGIMECCFWDNRRPVFVVKSGQRMYLFSYGVLVLKAVVRKNEILHLELGVKWDYSRATLRYITWWLSKSAKEIRQEIAEGKIIVKEKLK